MSSPETDGRILVLVYGLGLGGAEKLLATSAPLWAESSFTYRVAYVLPWKDQLVDTIRSSGVEVDCLGGRASDPRVAFRLRRLIRSWRPDLVHAHLPIAGTIARVVSPVPVVYTEHNLAGSYRPLVRLGNRATYRANAAVIAVSDAVARSLEGYPGPTPRVVPNGVLCEVGAGEAEAARRELDLDPDARLVVHVGNLRPHKGHRNLVETAAVLERAGSKAILVSIGGEKHPGDLERLRAEVAARGLEHRLRFLGRRDDARAFIAAADVFVSPADVEGLPVAILEALALGRPVAATAVGGVPSVVVDGETGILVPPGDPEALADAVERLLADAEWAARLGKAGQALVETEYGLEKMVAAYEQVYREILGT